MKFYCVGGEDLVRGFRLAGVDGRVVSGPAEAEAALAAAAAMPDCGVVILGAEAAGLGDARVRELKLGRARPLIVEV